MPTAVPGLLLFVAMLLPGLAYAATLGRSRPERRFVGVSRNSDRRGCQRGVRPARSRHPHRNPSPVPQPGSGPRTAHPPTRAVCHRRNTRALSCHYDGSQPEPGGAVVDVWFVGLLVQLAGRIPLCPGHSHDFSS
jgi:hypothetical protein